MKFTEIIEIKKRRKKLSEKQINFFVNGAVNKTIPEYQTSALLMAIWFNGLSDDELYYFTKAMIASGETIKLKKNYKKVLIDKHSTGGIGDKVTIALAPILACFNLGVGKLSGRGLGFTGGTIDKLEAIGVKTDLSVDAAVKVLKETDMFVISQSPNIVPADKLFYSLRDVTGTVDSLPLIAASILSKKFVVDSDYIFIDIKYGAGAFCQNIATAKKLGNIMTKLAQKFSRNLRFELSDMNKVLGRTIGNAIEVKEAVDYLRNQPNVGQDYKDLMANIICNILVESKTCKTHASAQKQLNQVLSSGAAFERFCQWIKAQGGNLKAIKTNTFFSPKYQHVIKATKSGVVSYPDVVGLAEIAVDLGAGRRVKEDVIDFQAGIYLHAKDNDSVNKDDPVLTLYSNNPISKKIIEQTKKLIKLTKK